MKLTFPTYADAVEEVWLRAFVFLHPKALCFRDRYEVWLYHVDDMETVGQDVTKRVDFHPTRHDPEAFFADNPYDPAQDSGAVASLHFVDGFFRNVWTWHGMFGHQRATHPVLKFGSVVKALYRFLDLPEHTIEDPERSYAGHKRYERHYTAEYMKVLEEGSPYRWEGTTEDCTVEIVEDPEKVDPVFPPLYGAVTLDEEDENG